MGKETEVLSLDELIALQGTLIRYKTEFDTDDEYWALIDNIISLVTEDIAESGTTNEGI